MRHRGILSGKGQVLFFEPYVNATIREAEDHLAQIIQVACEPIHQVADHRVAFTNVAGQLLQLRPMDTIDVGW